VFVFRNIGDYHPCRSQWPRGLRLRSSASRLLRLWFRIPPGAWMFVRCDCCVLSGRGLCGELITHPDDSYRLWCVDVCDLETSWIRRPWPTGGSGDKTNKQTNHPWVVFMSFGVVISCYVSVVGQCTLNIRRSMFVVCGVRYRCLQAKLYMCCLRMCFSYQIWITPAAMSRLKSVYRAYRIFATVPSGTFSSSHLLGVSKMEIWK
jgi:hypothetical protein